MRKIVCKNCGKILAVSENGWIKIKGETNYSSNGEKYIFKCQDCEKINVLEKNAVLKK